LPGRKRWRQLAGAHLIFQLGQAILPCTATVGDIVDRATEAIDFEHGFSLRRREEGQTMAEYGVVLAVLTIGAVAAFTALSGGVSNAINNVTGLFPGG